MKKELEDGLKALDLLNFELENIKDYLLQSKAFSSNVSANEDIDSFGELQEENAILKQQLLDYREFLNSILENLNDIFITIEELKNNE